MAQYRYEVVTEPETGRARFRCSCGRCSPKIGMLDAQRALELMGGNAFPHRHIKRRKATAPR